MSSELNQLRLEQLQATVSAYADMVKRPRPSRGWLKLIREALGRTERQQALRLGISGSTLHTSEQSEADDRITLGQLRKLADGLDCELVYALVPRRQLETIVSDRAALLASRQLARLVHSMALEGQAVLPDPQREQMALQAERLIDRPGLWRDG